MTLVDAWDLLYETLTADTADGTPHLDFDNEFVTRVFQGIPNQGGEGIWLTTSPVSFNATDYQFEVAIYTDPTADTLALQREAANAAHVTNRLLDLNEQIGRSDFALLPLEQSINRFIWTTTVEIGREDFGGSQRD